MIKTVTIVALVLSGVIFLSLNPIKAQIHEVELKTYQNPALGFSLQYPSNWRVSSDGIVQFYSPDRKDEYFDIFYVSVKDVKRYLDTETLTIKNRTAQEYAQERLHGLSTTTRTTYFKEFNISGNPGWKIEYTVNLGLMDLPKKFAGGLHLGEYKFEIFTVANGKIYTLGYAEEPLKVPDTLPLVNKTVESFRS